MPRAVASSGISCKRSSISAREYRSFGWVLGMKPLAQQNVVSKSIIGSILSFRSILTAIGEGQKPCIKEETAAKWGIPKVREYQTCIRFTKMQFVYLDIDLEGFYLTCTDNKQRTRRRVKSCCIRPIPPYRPSYCGRKWFAKAGISIVPLLFAERRIASITALWLRQNTSILWAWFLFPKLRSWTIVLKSGVCVFSCNMQQIASRESPSQSEDHYLWYDRPLLRY